ncbi:hypothetical protein JCM6882_006943 [Rhodosporidiobolus microsporus]
MAGSGQLPAVERRYKSIDDFKRAVYEVCLDQGYHLVVTRSHIPLELSCSLSGNRHASSSPCSCYIVLEAVPHSSPQEFKGHEEKEEEEIQLSKEPASPSSSGRKRRRTASAKYVFDNDEEEDDAGNEAALPSFSDTSFALPTSFDTFATPPLPKPSIQTTYSSKAKRLKPTPSSSSSPVFSSAPRTGVETQVKQTPLDIPPTQYRFFLLADLLKHLYAFAARSAFKLVNVPVSSSSPAPSFRLAGVISQPLPAKFAILCEIFGELAANGTWGVVEHTYSRIKRAPPRRQEKDGTSEMSSVNQVPTTPQRSKPILVSLTTSTPLFPSPSPVSAAQPSTRVSDNPPTNYFLLPPTVQPLSPSLPPFLAALFPSLTSDERVKHSKLLPKCGLSTVTDLVEILLMDEHALKVLVEGVWRKTACGLEEAWGLFEVLQKASKEVRAGIRA